MVDRTARYEYPIWYAAGVPNPLALFVAMALHKGDGTFSFGDADFHTVVRGVRSVVVHDAEETTTVTLRWHAGLPERRDSPRHPAWLRSDWRPPRWETVDSRDTLRLEPAARVFAASLGRAVDDWADARRIAVFRRRYGLDGEPGGTLEAIGRSFGISASRVRHLLWQAVAEIHALARSRAASDSCVQVVSIARCAIGDPVAGVAPVRLRKFTAAALPRVRPITGARLVVDLASIGDAELEHRHRERLCSIAASLAPRPCWPRPHGREATVDAAARHA